MDVEHERRRAAEIARIFAEEFEARDPRTKDLPRLDALIVELRAIVQTLGDAADTEHALLARLDSERVKILDAVARAPIGRGEIHVSEPGARANLYAKLHARGFRPDVDHLDLALLREIVEGLERAYSDVVARTPATPAAWMSRNVEIIRLALAEARVRHATLLESWETCDAERRRHEIRGLLRDQLAIVHRERTTVPAALVRPRRLAHIAATLRWLAARLLGETQPSVAEREMAANAEQCASQLDDDRSALLRPRATQDLTMLLEQELRELDALHLQHCGEPLRPDADAGVLAALLERAVSVGLQASDLWNETRSKRHDALLLESRKRVALFELQEQQVHQRRARRASLQ